jgi:pre-rRNA-processing protein TSR1
LKKRSKDEMEFEDEVDYPADISVKERFKKYKGLKNFRTSEWKKTVFYIFFSNYL